FVFVARPLTVAMKPDVMLSRHLAKSLVVRHGRLLLQIAPALLFFLERLEQRLEVSFAETLGAFPLNDFEKQSRPVFHRFRKDLQQITFVVTIDEDPELAQRF